LSRLAPLHRRDRVRRLVAAGAGGAVSRQVVGAVEARSWRAVAPPVPAAARDPLALARRRRRLRRLHRQPVREAGLMRTVAIIQARMGSSRLPGKVLRDLCGTSMLARGVERLRRARSLADIVIATTDGREDDAIVAEARRLGVDVFRGSASDVLSRYHGAAR